jgi:Lrp/AsnC family leucine-responsive transcriptional regulator
MNENIYKLDKKDKKILYELDKNARQSNSSIAKIVGLSKEIVNYRIKNMEKANLILRYSTIIDFFKLGLRKFKLYLKLRNANKEKIEEIGSYFNNHQKTEWVVICSGRWDIVANFIVNDVSEFDEEVQKVLNKYSIYIQEKATITTLHLSHATREFLSENEKIQKKYIYYKVNGTIEKIDNIDIEILKILSNNARYPVTEIAKKIKSTSRITSYRIKNLEKKGIILAYKITLNPRKIGNIFCKAIFYLGNITNKRLNEFMNYCHNIKQAVWPQRVLGAWDIELDVEVKGYEEFNDLLLDIKEKFSDIIINNDFLIVSKEFKLNFYPGCYPKFEDK